MNWLNVLSLDAPLVALVWQAFFARCLNIQLIPAAYVVLALSVWLAYAGDRWLDSRQLSQTGRVSLRHQFARDHQKGLAIVWLIVLSYTVWLAQFSLPRASFRQGLALLGLVFLHFTAIHRPAARGSLGGVKEAATALLFAAGTALFVVNGNLDRFVTLAPALAVWTLLCFLNCCSIACWELDCDQAQGQASICTRWPALARALPPALLTLTGLTLLLAVLIPTRAFAPAAGAAALSFLILFVLDRFSNRLRPGQLRIGADLALLTPALFLIVL